MSNRGYQGYQGYPQDHQAQGQTHGQTHGQAPPGSNPWASEQSQNQQQNPQQHQQQYNAAPPDYAPPAGPPPPHRTNTFNEAQFIPESERGEQREAIEQFELSRSKPESQTDRDVATLQQEFPGVDGSLIAALYGDSQSLSGTREMLQELASQDQGK